MVNVPSALVAAPDYRVRAAAVWLTPEGEVLELDAAAALARAAAEPPLVCHLPALARRLGGAPFPAYDLLELFAFALPALPCVPTPGGIARALGLAPPRSPAGAAASLRDAASLLLRGLDPADEQARALLPLLAGASWPWAAAVAASLGVASGDGRGAGGLAVWRGLPEWSGEPPPPPPGSRPVAPTEARRRLARLLGPGAEPRPSQADYASAACAAFGPREAEDAPILVLAEAGTGTGKTLAYVAPASLWAERNGAPVWISTFTRNLQRQIDGELDRLYPDPEDKAERVVIRKGRENYLCLLNYEEAAARAAVLPERQRIGLALMARWVARTRDGDQGGDLPGWMADLFGHAATLGLADRRGECIYAACAHYQRCFVERSQRRARHAELVIANHALVLTQAATAGDGAAPTRYVFDEGHHLFEAADAAYATQLSGRETAELRRWILGPEGGRGRSLAQRARDLAGDDGEARHALEALEAAARGLPGRDWRGRLAAGLPAGPGEVFLAAARAQVLARAVGGDGPYGIEAELRPLAPALAAALPGVARVVAELGAAATRLGERLARRLDAEADALDSATRARIEGLVGGLARRAVATPAAWRAMLRAAERDEGEAGFVDWLAVERQDGRELDVGLYRRWLDPMRPFAEAMARRAHGILVTSATLADGSGDLEADWRVAEARAGAPHLPRPALRVRVASPFDYGRQTRVLIVNDVDRDDPDRVAAGFRELFLAAGGGALGLFTAIARLKEVQARLAPPLAAAGLDLYAQHVDALDAATLVDIFRAEVDSCLLGTDAVRDGVDVPGRALRLIVFDRVPWPRPGILHRARRAAMGGASYDDMLTRFRLAQAFGRLVRRADDRGVFVLLDARTPSRLLGAFPKAAPVARLGLAAAIAATRQFLAPAPT